MPIIEVHCTRLASSNGINVETLSLLMLKSCTSGGFLNQSSKSLWCRLSFKKTHTQTRRLGTAIYISAILKQKYHLHKNPQNHLEMFNTKKIIRKVAPKKFPCWKKPWLGLRVLELNYMWSSQQRFFQPPP